MSVNHTACADFESHNSPTTPTPTNEAVRKPERDYVLAAMRVGRLRVTLLGTEIDTVGVALKNNLITIEDAIYWLDEIGALHFLAPEIGVAP
jgi:hypothetical protein